MAAAAARTASTSAPRPPGPPGSPRPPRPPSANPSECWIAKVFTSTDARRQRASRYPSEHAYATCLSATGRLSQSERRAVLTRNVDAAADAQLAVDDREVGLHPTKADKQGGRDLAVVASGGGERGHRLLGGGESRLGPSTVRPVEL